MNISGTSSSSGAISVPTNNRSQIATLQKQAQSIDKQISDENKGKDDAKTKQQVVQELEAELMMIQMQIQQLQAAQEQKAQNSSAARSQNQDQTQDQDAASKAGRGNEENLIAYA